MKLTEEQIENIEWKDMEKMLDDAIQNGDKEFITSVLPLLDIYYMDAYHDYFEYYFDNDLFKDRDIALFFAKCGYDVPKDLYENDEEMILAAVGAPGSHYRGFDLASDKLLNNKEFVKKMFDSIGDYGVLEEMLEYDVNPDGNTSLLPDQVLEDGEIEQFIKNRIQELKEKEEQDKKQTEEPSETPSELQQLASTKKELEQIVSELRENIASAQKLLASYEELLNGGKQNDSNEGQTFGEE